MLFVIEASKEIQQTTKQTVFVAIGALRVKLQPLRLQQMVIFRENKARFKADLTS